MPRLFLGLGAFLSLASHAGMAVWFVNEETPPILYGLREGKFSVAIQATRTETKPLEKKIEPPILKEEPRFLTALKESPKAPPISMPKPKPKLPEKKPEPKKEKPPEPPKKLPEPKVEPVKVEPKKELPKELPVAKQETGASAASEGADKLDNPVAVFNPSPVYPLDLQQRGIEGRVVLWLYIDRNGHVDPSKSSIKISSGNAILDESALRTSAAWRFIPGKRGGVPTAGWTPQTFSFYISNRNLATFRP